MRTDTICTISAGTDFRNQVLSRLYRLTERIKRTVINRKTGLILASTVILAEPQLTKREKEILILIRQGFLSKEIAYKLNLSIYTVNNHRKNILAKLNVDNAIEAINKAENFGILY